MTTTPPLDREDDEMLILYFDFVRRPATDGTGEKEPYEAMGRVDQKRYKEAMAGYKNPLMNLDSGRESNTRAEIRAAHDGLVHCINHGLKNIILESDSYMVVSFLSGSSRPGWKWKCWVDRIRILCSYGNVQFHHICREGNGPADGMANLGCGNQASALFHSIAALPQVVRGLLFLDKVGLGTVRKRFKR